MKTEELRNLIAGSPHQQWCENQILVIQNTELDLHREIKGIVAMYEYAQQQLKGWENFSQPLRVELQESRVKPEKLIEIINELVANFEARKIEIFKSKFQNTISGLFAANNKRILIYDLPETDFLFELDKKFPFCFKGAFDYLTGMVEERIIYQKNYFLGMQLAADFIGKTKGIKSKKIDISSVVHTEINLTSYLNQAEKQLSSLVTEIKEQEKGLIEEIAKSNLQREAHFEEWFNLTKEHQDTLYKATKEQSENLLNTFKEHMRLQKPAEYWEERAKKLKKEGRWLLGLLVVLVMLGSTALYFLLWKTPEGMLKSFFDNDHTAALRWSVIFIVFISFIFLGIRYVSKMMFSAYHLARDAEERHQLTHVYLALIKEGSMDEKERQLIMQSLFSRADTGLLKEESQPTMPGGVEKLMK